MGVKRGDTCSKTSKKGLSGYFLLLRLVETILKQLECLKKLVDMARA